MRMLLYQQGSYYKLKPSEMENQNYHDMGVQANSPSRIPFKQLKNIQNNLKPQSYVPFLFRNTNKREISCMNTPAPGEYEHKSCFGNKDGRTLLKEKYQIEMENSRKIKESMAFKSATKRFNYKQKPDLIPISYSHSQSSKQLNNFNQSLSKSRQISLTLRSSTAETSNCYPSIPDASLRYGYSLGGEGKLKKIQKTETQLDNEKEDMKKYVKKLEGQKNYFSNNMNYYLMPRSKNPVIEEVKRKVQGNEKQNFNKNSSSCLNQNITSPFKKKRPNQKKSSQGNQFRICQIMEQKRQVQKMLGPGTYNENNSTSFETKLKPQKFQFFNSTSERFKMVKFEKSESSARKMEISKKMDEFKRMRTTNFKKGLRRYEKSTQKTVENSRQETQYGQKRQQRMSFSKNSKTDQALRFELNNSNGKAPKNLSSRIYKGSLFHENSLQKREKLQAKHRYIRVLTNGQSGQSDYSICSWEDRPFSRNDGVQFKENKKQL